MLGVFVDVPLITGDNELSDGLADGIDLTCVNRPLRGLGRRPYCIWIPTAEIT